jgi:hypothetical protein
LRHYRLWSGIPSCIEQALCEERDRQDPFLYEMSKNGIPSEQYTANAGDALGELSIDTVSVEPAVSAEPPQPAQAKS